MEAQPVFVSTNLATFEKSSARRDIQSVVPTEVMKVYAGKAGKCCCGCAGKHTYSTLHLKAAAARRGYEISADEISDRGVLSVLRRLQAALALDPSIDFMDADDVYAAEVGGRLLMVQLAPTG